MPYLNSMFGFSYGYILAPTQNPAQHPEKICEKVAETAEIPKTAPKTQLKSRKYNIPKEIDIEFLRYPISRTLTIRNPLS